MLNDWWCICTYQQSHINHIHDAVLDYMNRKNLPFSGIVHNAGLGYHAPLEIHALDDIRRLFEVNFFGPIAVTQRFLPLIREQQVGYRVLGRVNNLHALYEFI